MRDRRSFLACMAALFVAPVAARSARPKRGGHVLVFSGQNYNRLHMGEIVTSEDALYPKTTRCWPTESVEAVQLRELRSIWWSAQDLKTGAR